MITWTLRIITNNATTSHQLKFVKKISHHQHRNRLVWGRGNTKSAPPQPHIAKINKQTIAGGREHLQERNKTSKIDEIVTLQSTSSRPGLFTIFFNTTFHGYLGDPSKYFQQKLSIFGIASWRFLEGQLPSNRWTRQRTSLPVDLHSTLADI